MPVRIKIIRLGTHALAIFVDRSYNEATYRNNMLVGYMRGAGIVAVPTRLLKRRGLSPRNNVELLTELKALGYQARVVR